MILLTKTLLIILLEKKMFSIPKETTTIDLPV